MTRSLKITDRHLERKAVVYIRQSSYTQVMENVESGRRQYDLRATARQLRFRGVEVIDADMGRSASGAIHRPGFERLFAEVAAGEIGAIFCIEASRLARNGREWHTLIEVCGMVETLLIDPEGVYDPRIGNDRLLLGLKGAMSEYELTLLRQRAHEAVQAKAARGELRFQPPVGLCWPPKGTIELDPNRRVQEAIRLVFTKFEKVRSIRQVLLWFLEEEISLPVAVFGQSGREIAWKLPTYPTIRHVIVNPCYAGAYAYGKRETRILMVEGRPRKTWGHWKAREDWKVLIRDHHPGYITWSEYERNQRIVEENAYMKKHMGRKSGRGGRGLLAGLVRCRRCGLMLHIRYGGEGGKVPRYYCTRTDIAPMGAHCISFGSLGVERAVSKEVISAAEGPAIEAALEAAERVMQEDSHRRKALFLELEQARYEARLAARRYEAVDPDNRLVAGELEAGWNASLERVSELEARVQEAEYSIEAELPDRALLETLATDLSNIWNDPATDMRAKQRIVQILLKEIVADVDEERQEIVLVLHWTGGRHSELRVRRGKTGRHRRCTSMKAIDVIRQMAKRWSDQQIAATLNRIGLRTGAGNPWNESRVAWVRSYHKLPGHDRSRAGDLVHTLEEAAKHLGICPNSVKQLIKDGVLHGRQVVPCAPWEIPAKALASEEVVHASEAIKARRYRRLHGTGDEQTQMIPNL